jgi:phosphate uptake regulator
MDTQQNIQALRLHLLDMSKLSQRSVDYAIKGYRLGSPEFCRYVRRGDRQLRELRRRITDLCQNLPVKELAVDAEGLTGDLAAGREGRFSPSALRICGALQATCTAAAEIAHHTMLLLEDARVPACAALEKVCYLVNRLVCLCIVALFKQESQHAETVLQNQEIGRLFEQAFHDLRNDIDRRITISAALELAITNSLRQIARQAHEIAEAIVFWLEGRRCHFKSAVNAHQ